MIPSLRLKALFGVALLVGLALGGACSQGEKLAVRKVLVDVTPGATGPGGVLEREKLRALVHAHLAGDSRIQLVEQGEDAAVLRVRLEAASVTPRQDGQETSLSLALEASGGPGGIGKRWHFQGHTVATGTDPGAFADLAERALDDCIGQIVSAKAAQHQPSETLLAWLDDEKASADQKRQAVRLLGARKEAAAVPALVKLLRGEDRELAQASLGALTLIGDPRAVDGVIEYAEAKPSLIRKQVIEAVRVMGGKRGMAWLFTMSTGHADPDVQAAAGRALAQLEARVAASDATQVAETGE